MMTIEASSIVGIALDSNIVIYQTRKLPRTRFFKVAKKVPDFKTWLFRIQLLFVGVYF